ncbi:MAG: alpha/beta hydrolase [Bacteroidales bacterium]|nr:alpha/beta hydrolase [Bacteroidales bacterium]
MKRLLIAFFALALTACAPQYIVHGPQGGIATKTVLPDGFNPDTDSCRMVILMHGIFSSKDYPPMPGIARELAEHGIGSIAIDFGGHGKSEGKKVSMTIPKELQEARAVWNYLKSLPYVRGISLLGHSQGGVIASMLAGELASEGDAPESVILLAPGSVIKEACQGGHFFGNTFDPKDPPEYIKCFGFYKVGREYMLSSQELDIYGTSAKFQGPVCIIHGTEDGTVQLWCSEKYDSTYVNSTLHLIEGENHLMISHLKETKAIITDFLK